MERKTVAHAAQAACDAEIGTAGRERGDDVLAGEELTDGLDEGVPQRARGWGDRGVLVDEVLDFYVDIADGRAEHVVDFLLRLPR